MKTQINLIRAIGSEFAGRKLRLILLIFGIITLIALLAMGWLITLSIWWWLLAVPVMVMTLLGLMVGIMASILVKLLRPVLTKSQAAGVKKFVDKLERVAENIQTPMFMIVFRVMRDIIRPGKKTFIQTVTHDSTTLHKDFIKLQRDFAQA